MPFYPYVTPLNSRLSPSVCGCPPSFFDTVTKKHTSRGAGASSCFPTLLSGSPHTSLPTCLHPFSVSPSLPLSRPIRLLSVFPVLLFFRPPSSAFYPRPSSVTFPVSVVLASRPPHSASIPFFPAFPTAFPLRDPRRISFSFVVTDDRILFPHPLFLPPSNFFSCISYF